MQACATVLSAVRAACQRGQGVDDDDSGSGSGGGDGASTGVTVWAPFAVAWARQDGDASGPGATPQISVSAQVVALAVGGIADGV